MVQFYLHVTLSGDNQETLRGALVWDLVRSITAIMDAECSYGSGGWVHMHPLAKNTYSAHAPATLIKAYPDNW